MARLRLSVKGIDWAASLVQPWQHETADNLWAAHHQVAHLLAVETENFQPRIRRILAERPAIGALGWREASGEAIVTHPPTPSPKPGRGEPGSWAMG